MTELEMLTAILDIQSLKARRLRAMDEKRWDDYEALHAQDHVSETYAAGPAVGARMNAQRIASVLDGVTSIHHAHSPHIVIHSPDSASGVWAMEDRLYWTEDGQEHWLHGFGHYHERYRKGPEGWQFVRRKLTRIRVERSSGATRFAAA